MDKNELLKYLICEIDLVMHDKDYRFENEDGTWYSRESCKNLTNEEVFEELKSELRQLAKIEDDFADLEAKLAEKDQAIESLQEINQSLGQTCNNDAKEIERLREELAEKDVEIEKLKIILSMQAVQVPEEQRLNLITTNCIQYNPNQTAIEVLEKVQKYIVEDAKSTIGYPYLKNSVMILNFVCDQIKSLKGDENGEN